MRESTKNNLSIIISIIALIFSGGSFLYTYNNYKINESNYLLQSEATWFFHVNNDTKNIKVDTTTENIRLERVSVHFPHILDKYLDSTEKFAFSFSSVFYMDTSNNTFDLGMIKNPLCLLITRESKSLLGEGIPVCFEISYVYRTEKKVSKVIYLLPFTGTAEVSVEIGHNPVHSLSCSY